MELRGCASYTGETRLIKAYEEGVDVHRLTASTLFGVPPEQVTDAQRSGSCLGLCATNPGALNFESVLLWKRSRKTHEIYLPKPINKYEI
jgi:DNA polymerase I